MNKKESNSYSLKTIILVFVLALILGILIGQMFFKTTNVSSKKNDMTTVYDTLKSQYIKKIDDKKLNEAAIKGMIDFIKKEYKDDYTLYYDEKDTTSFTELLTGKFYGTGAEIYKKEDNPVTISRVFKNSPAEKAGLKPGDQYIKINGEDVTDKKADEISKMIKGKVKKTYDLVIRRDGKELKFTITTDIVDIPSVESKVIKKDNQKIGYIYIGIFASNTDEQFLEELNKLNKDKITKLIIDLRYDSGGDLDSVINIASNFMSKDQVVVKIVDKDNTTDKLSVKDSKNNYDLAILVNGQSASGSEVLASALRDNSGAVLIGEKTYGKGSVQRTKSLASGSMIKYTVQTWETSKNEQINKKGVKPDIEVKFDENYFKTFKEEDDNQLQKALEVLADKN